MEDRIRLEDRWYVLATSSRADDRTRVLKHDDLFALFDRFGDVQPIGSGEPGLYFQGTRFLSHLEFRLDGQRPMLLNSDIRQDNSLLTVDLTTPDLQENGTLKILKGTVHVYRTVLLWDGACHQHFRFVNYNPDPVVLNVSVEFAADFADIFEARGFKRARRGTDLGPQLSEARVVLGYSGLDGVSRRTLIDCSPAPIRLGGDRIDHVLALPDRGWAQLELAIACEVDESRRVQVSYAQALANAEETQRRAQARSAAVNTSNAQFNDWVSRSAADLAMLTTDKFEGPYPYAGVPWYSTPFGRDGLLTALMCLWADPAMARGVLAFLAHAQATEVRTEQDAEPGKILHEMRDGELAALGEIPFGRYYGSVDSTPLFIVLAGAYYERTGDLDFARRIWPHVGRALSWIDHYGDLDGDGFVEYERRTERGLRNQGWKDSEDAVFHHDGRLADGAIALAEVQGYVYQARLHAATLAAALGSAEPAAALRQQAAELRRHFEDAYWCEELDTYALALDGAKEPCRVRSSNAGQVLWSGIGSDERAARVADSLFSPASFSGWGVRTIGEGESRYNPMAYHNGSVWPHDNALIGMGLARYGMKDRAIAILTALFEASVHMDLRRLPELFCGFVRRPNVGPTLYPVACSPQAWAGASVFCLVQACLGLSFDPDPPRIVFRNPQLPEYLAQMEIRNLRMGDAEVDLLFRRHRDDVGVSVLRKVGALEVSVVW